MFLFDFAFYSVERTILIEKRSLDVAVLRSTLTFTNFRSLPFSDRWCHDNFSVYVLGGLRCRRYYFYYLRHIEFENHWSMVDSTG